MVKSASRTGGEKIRVLIVETNTGYQDVLLQCVTGAADVSVQVIAAAGPALECVRQEPPHVVLVDTALRDMEIVEFMTQVWSLDAEIGIIITVPEVDQVGANQAIEALAAGAFDYVLKPDLHVVNVCDVLQRRLLPKIRSFSIRRYSRQARRAHNPATVPPAAIAPCLPQKSLLAHARMIAAANPYEVVLIGVSTGGPEALQAIVPQFPAYFPVPVVIVLHMPRLFTLPMARALDRMAILRVHETVPGQLLEPGHCYLAAGGRHLLITRNSQGALIAHATDDPPENGCRPAVDVLFRSAAQVTKDRTLAVVLTGMGSDGLKGAKLLKQQGATVIAQDEHSSLIWGMPGSVVQAGYADQVLPLNGIVPDIVARAVRS